LVELAQAVVELHAADVALGVRDVLHDAFARRRAQRVVRLGGHRRFQVREERRRVLGGAERGGSIRPVRFGAQQVARTTIEAQPAGSASFSESRF
jgi:hypothetical protein